MNTDIFPKFTFTPEVKHVLESAQAESRRFNHNYIGTEHLLLGLILEGSGVPAKVLTNLGVELNKVRSAVEFIIGQGDRMVTGEPGLTPRAKKVIELAQDESRRLGHHYVGTEHLLLGLVQEGEGIASGILESMGVKLEAVRTETLRYLGQPTAGEGQSTLPDKAWEYLCIRIVLGASDDMAQIQEAGSKGWELVSVVPWASRHGLYYFKRPIPRP